MEFDGHPLHWEGSHWQFEAEEWPWGELRNSRHDVSVCSENHKRTPPCQKQEETWRHLLSNQDRIYQIVLKAVFNYYRKIRPQYAAAGPEWIENMPVLTEPSQLNPKIGLTFIQIDWPVRRTVKIGLMFRCDWDSEHGLGLVLKRDKVIDIGGEDCAILF